MCKASLNLCWVRVGSGSCSEFDVWESLKVVAYLHFLETVKGAVVSLSGRVDLNC